MQKIDESGRRELHSGRSQIKRHIERGRVGESGGREEVEEEGVGGGEMRIGKVRDKGK